MHLVGLRPAIDVDGWLRAAAFAAVLTAVLALRADLPTEWDSWEYAARAINGETAAMGLGRWWFVVVMHGAFRTGRAFFGLTPINGHVAMQVTAALMMAGAVVALMAWTRRLTQSRAAELIAAALVLPGPVLGLYGAAIMTEGMALLFLTSAFLAWDTALARAQGASAKDAWPWALVAGLAFGIAVNVREPVLLFAAWPVLSGFAVGREVRGRLLAIAAGAAAAAFAIGIIGAWLWSPRADGYLAGIAQWAGYMASARQRYPVDLAGNLLFFATACLAALPVATALIPSTVGWAVVRRSPLVWLIVATLPYLVANVLNHDLAITGRYAIPFVWLLVPVIAAATVDILGRSRLRSSLAGSAIAVAGCVVFFLAWPTIRQTYFDDVASKQRVMNELLAIPESGGAGPVIVAGESTPVAGFLVATGLRRFRIIEGGWAWPHGRAADVVARYLREGADVYVNVERAPASLVLPRDDDEAAERIELARRYGWDTRWWPLVYLIAPPALARR
jgi:dolichyl-phosphate-mannose-protein mannosyltransferase